MASEVTTKEASFGTIESSEEDKYLDEYNDLDRKEVAYPYGERPVLMHRWSFGYDGRKRILNISTEYCCIVCLTSANMIFLYNYEYKSVALLTGHVNNIFNLAGDETGRWLATFGRGPNNRIVVWDIGNGVPVRTIYIDNMKAEHLTMSPNGKYLILTFDEDPPRLNFFIWASAKKTPLAEVEFDRRISSITGVEFSKRCEEYFVVTAKNQVVFITFNKECNKLEFHNPETNDWWPSGPIEYNCSVYNKNVNICYTATTTGKLALWGDNTILERLLTDEDKAVYLRQLKAPLTNQLNGKILLRLLNQKIIVMKFEDDYLICLDELSVIYFYNIATLKVVYKFDELCQDGILYFQMNQRPRIYETDQVEENPNPNAMRESKVSAQDGDAAGSSLEKSKFLYDLSNSTGSALRQSKFLHEFESNVKKENIKEWHSIEAVYTKTEFENNEDVFKIRDLIIQTKNNKLIYLNPVTKQMYRIFEDSIHNASVIDTDPVREYICIGTTCANLYLYDYTNKIRIMERKIVPMNAETAGITALKYSPNGFVLTCGMSDGTFYCLYPLILKGSSCSQNYDCRSKAAIHIIQFCRDSKYVAYADQDMVIALFATAREFIFVGWLKSHFGAIQDITFCTWDKVTKLYSIGEDRYLNEFDVIECLRKKTLVLSRRIMIDLEAIPVSMVPSPICSKLLIISMSNFQFRTLDTSTMLLEDIRKAPTLNFPTHLLQPNNSGNISDNEFLTFASSSKIGIIKCPVDGNPFKWVTLRTGTSMISSMCSSRDGSHVFSITQDHPFVQMWDFHSRNLNHLEIIGGDGLKPYYGLLKSGINNPNVKLLQELFCLALYQHQGTYSVDKLDLTNEREVTLCEVPGILRGMGIFPSNKEMENILCMHSFKSKLISEQRVPFKDLAKLYLNLQQDREKFDPLETYNLLRLLADHQEGDHYYYDGIGDMADYKFLPPKITFKHFMKNLIGFKGDELDVDSEDSEETEAEPMNVYKGEPLFLKAMCDK